MVWKTERVLISLQFQKTNSDVSLFHRKIDGALTLILVYVDDILITGDSPTQISEVIRLLNIQFALKHPGLVHYFLGIEVHHTAASYSLSQSQYIRDRHNLLDCNSCSHPMSASLKLSKDHGTALDNPNPYRSAVGALQYLTLTRPDIAFSVNKLSQFLKNPTDVHSWNACKHLLRYLKDTHDISLVFSPSTSISFSGFADADWASSPDDRRSTGGHCIRIWSPGALVNSPLLAEAARSQSIELLPMRLPIYFGFTEIGIYSFHCSLTLMEW